MLFLKNRSTYLNQQENEKRNTKLEKYYFIDAEKLK